MRSPAANLHECFHYKRPDQSITFLEREQFIHLRHNIQTLKKCIFCFPKDRISLIPMSYMTLEELVCREIFVIRKSLIVVL